VVWLGLAWSVELLAEQFGGAAVGSSDERGVHPQGGRATAAVAEPAGDGAQVHPGGEQLGRRVVAAEAVSESGSRGVPPPGISENT
jgi:hypothetical protein